MTSITQGTETLEARRADLNIAVATAYDLQKLRIMTGNRLCASFRQKLGLQPAQSEDDLEEQNKKAIKRIREDYQLMTQGVVAVTNPDGRLIAPRLKQFKPVGCITSYGEFMLVQQYVALEAQEDDHFSKTLPSMLQGFPIYEYYLNHVKGIGPAMAAILVRYFDIEKCHNPSQFWAYAGLDVVNVKDEKTGEMIWQGRSKFKQHLVPRQYADHEGKVVDTMGIKFNPIVKTKLLGVLGGSFLKCKSPYAQLYYDYKNRLENHPAHVQKTKLHKHRMAIRYMIKQFLLDFYVNWCEIEGKPIPQTYQEKVLGHVHGGAQTRERLTRPVYPQTKRKVA